MGMGVTTGVGNGVGTGGTVGVGGSAQGVSVEGGGKVTVAPGVGVSTGESKGLEKTPGVGVAVLKGTGVGSWAVRVARLLLKSKMTTTAKPASPPNHSKLRKSCLSCFDI